VTKPTQTQTKKWQFWIDRGGTFTDIVASDPQGVISTHKLLSENPKQYNDAALQGIREFLSVESGQPIPVDDVSAVRMGTTVATNALLEHAGEPLLLLVTAGFKDALRIAYQQRPDLFALEIVLPKMLYAEVAEVDERVMADGSVSKSLDVEAVRQTLQTAYDEGLKSVAIVFMHGYQYSDHEKQVAKLACQIGFQHISVSHEISPLIRYISRGDTTVVDAYLSPILRRYVKQIEAELPDTPLLFMQSSGGLTKADYFQGKDAILSGPAGGVVGMISTAEEAGFSQLIGFDMGGTSTDVCHYQGDYERTMETQIGGMRICAPMMRIHTVAAGGGSILHYDQHRFRVGPDSAGAYPGPAAYRAGGPLTITDCNVLLGKLQPNFFPHIFGDKANQSLDVLVVKKRFEVLAQMSKQSAEQMAEGFLTITVENMANAIKKISVQRGYDVSDYTLCCFGGAGGQHACLVADALGMERIFLHEYSGVLSAYGMGLADIRKIRRSSLDVVLKASNEALITRAFQQLTVTVKEDVTEQFAGKVENNDYKLSYQQTLHCKYEGSDSLLELGVNDASIVSLQQQFTSLHQQQFGFSDANKMIIVASIEVEVIASESITEEQSPYQERHSEQVDSVFVALAYKAIYLQGGWQQVPFYQRETIPLHTLIKGPAIILESTGTIVVEAGWQAELQAKSQLVLTRYAQSTQLNGDKVDVKADPVKLEIFNNLFMSIAEQMGFVLEQTAVSVNIKERLDFSCAIFDPDGNLVANAPHMPVHLGSMSESIKTVINKNKGTIAVGDVFMLNDPYNGGTHLPDITIIRPVFIEELETAREGQQSQNEIIFYVASRGHHADIGGIAPGSIPPNSQSIDEEGVLIDNFKLVKAGVLQEQLVRELLTSGEFPVRNIDYNIADLKAQLAACEKGTMELGKIIHQYGLNVVQAYMRYVQDNAEESVRQVIETLSSGDFCYEMDDGCHIKVNIQVDKENRQAVIDFTGTSKQHPGNLNAPTAITKAAVLYVFRTLVKENIPLNEGCLKPLKIIIPEASMLNPSYPSAVVAGNVETSQYIVDTLYGALGIMAASQGTMNNVTWGNAEYQYYETLCGGAGATAKADGADAVHTHMTNSRLTDPEVLEKRFPVMLESFSIRKNSSGLGRYKGGEGVIRKTRFLESMKVNILSGHRHIAPYGMNGGQSGGTGENQLFRANGAIEDLSFKDQVEVSKNDVLVVKTPGGGGYGKSFRVHKRVNR